MLLLIFQDDLVQDWPRKQYRTTTSYMGLSLARKQKLLQNLLLNWKKRRCSVYQFSQEAESKTQSSVFGHKKEEEDKIIRWWLVAGNFHGGSVLQAPAVLEPFVKNGRRGEGRLPMMVNIANLLIDQQM